jgi:anthranilate phosphoribosyltransferase
MKKMANVINEPLQISKATYIVHGQDGMDEISLCADSYLLRCENGKIFEEEIINPEKFGFKKTSLEALKGKDPKYNAEKLISLLNGKKSDYRNIVVLNAAFAFKLTDHVNEVGEGVKLAEEMLDSGLSKSVLSSLT